MSTKVEKLARQLNENFRDLLPVKFKEKFNVQIGTKFNFFTSALVSTRLDGEDFTPEQLEFINTFEAGYLAAMQQVHE